MQWGGGYGKNTTIAFPITYTKFVHVFTHTNRPTTDWQTYVTCVTSKTLSSFICKSDSTVGSYVVYISSGV